MNNAFILARPHVRGRILSAGLVLAGGLLAAGLSMADPKISILLLGVVVLVWVAAVVDWKAIILFALAWILVEALPRRYLINEPSLTLGTDALLALAYVKAFWHLWRSRRVSTLRLAPTVWTSLLLLVIWGVTEVFNPLLPSITVGLIGVRAWFFYTPLLVLAPHLFGTKAQLVLFLKRYLAWSIPLCLLGAAQVFAGPDNIINRNYLDFEINYASLGTFVVTRSISTFASNAVFAQYLFFMVFLGFALLQMATVRTHRALRVALPIALALGLLSTAGSTVPLVAGVLLPTMAIAGGRLRQSARVLRRWGLPVVFLAVVFYLVSPGIIESALGRIVSPFTSSSDGVDRMSNIGIRADNALEPVLAGLVNTPLGHGLGSASLGTQYVLGGRSQAAALAPIEGGYARIVWEVGAVGCALFLFLETAILWRLMALRRSLRDPDLRWVALAVAACHVGTLGWLVFANVIDSGTFAVLLWFFTGIGLGLRKWDSAGQGNRL